MTDKEPGFSVVNARCPNVAECDLPSVVDIHIGDSKDPIRGHRPRLPNVAIRAAKRDLYAGELSSSPDNAFLASPEDLTAAVDLRYRKWDGHRLLARKRARASLTGNPHAGLHPWADASD